MITFPIASQDFVLGHECGSTMQSIEALKLLPVWVNPDHMVTTAKIILAGHGVRVIAVVDDGKLVGTASLDRLASAPEFANVRSVMDPIDVAIEAHASIRQVAEIFVDHGLDYAPVVRGDRLLGIVTATMLLRELGRSWDPLTGLSWSDRLREWGIDQLKRNAEITILFIDLNDFGTYNKRFGHIVGDKVLRRVAQMIEDAVDPEHDVLVRYGGDEFAIGTIRAREDADDLAEQLRHRVRDLYIPDVDEGVTFCIGVYGGKRTKERENIHFAATLDNLINLASKECLAQKQLVILDPTPEARPEVEADEAIHPEGPAIRLINVFADDSAPNSLTQVILSVGDTVVSGINARGGRPVIESVATATAKALERAFPETTISIDDINLAQSADGRRVVSIAGHVQTGERSVLSSGAETVDKDLYASVARATIQAYLTAK